MTQWHELSVAEIGQRLRSGELTSVALTEYTLSRIDAINPSLHAFVHVTYDRALRDAARADGELKMGRDRGPLHGLPYALKDVIDTAGIPTTSHSHLRLDHVPDEDAEVERRLRAGGGVLVGKLATHEYALGGPSFELPFPPARNPWNPDHGPGGSSSGSGVAVAAGLVRVAVGTDTSGSVRGPASHCGVVGLKPTYGLVSRRGMLPLSYSLDHVGPLAATVADTAAALQVMAGYDPHDPGSSPRPVPGFTALPQEDLAGLRIGFAREMLCAEPEASLEVIAAIEGTAERLAELGAIVEEVTLPPFEQFNAVGRVIMAAEGFSVHEANLRCHPELFGRYTYQRLVPGAAVPAADLIRAFRLRHALTERLDREIFSRYDALLAGSALTPPPQFSDFGPDWPPPRAATLTQTIVFNVTGHPAVNVPVGLSSSGLPLGAQIAGRPFEDALVLRVAAALEAVSEGPSVPTWPPVTRRLDP
ncbi:MAG TPA: amidase [Micromonospora sp.]|nr:amidase [Micromonospora sp.]